MNDRRTQTTLRDGTSWRYGYDRLSQAVSGERVNTEGTPVQDGSFRYEYDGIGNRTFSQEGAPDAIRRYSSNALNQYTAVAETGFIPLVGRADEDANVVVTATVDGRSETYLPARDGQEFSVDIPVDNSRGAVTATVRVDALKQGDGQQASDLHRSLAGEYTVAAAVPETPSYDADGNMLSNDGWTYAWNAQDRLVSAAKGAIRLEFAYDYMGRRFEKKVYENDVLTKRSIYAYDGFKQIAEYDALDNNALLNTYLWQPEGLDVPLLRNGSEFYVSDANKNIVALIDASGAVTDTYAYAPFGSCTHTGSSTNPFRFSSEYHDDETDLVYYNYRYYSPELGRWTKMDPIGEEGGINLYGMLCNRQGMETDYLGLWWRSYFGFTSRHAEMTKRAFSEIKLTLSDGSQSEIKQFFINDVIFWNLWTDSGEYEKEQKFHYCREKQTAESIQEAQNAYKETLRSMRISFRNEVWIAYRLKRIELKMPHCNEAIKYLGIITHMLQDYYGHGVEKDDKSGHVVGTLKGDPDNPLMVPVSFGAKGFTGGHGG